MAVVTQFRGRIGGQHSGQRSKVTTGRKAFADIGDGRSPWARRWSDLIFAHASDLGGPDALSEAQISLCRRAAAIECELEAMEGHMSAGQPIDIGQYARLVGCLCRLLELVGIKRLTKPLDPQSELVRAMGAYASMPIDDDDEPAPIEEGFDKSGPGEAQRPRSQPEVVWWLDFGAQFYLL
jgi:hypothetical protein